MSDRPPSLRTDFSRESLAPAYVRAAYDYWCRARGAERLPPVEAIDPTRLPVECLPYLSVLEVERDPLRFRSRLTATAVVEALGDDQTGRYLDEIDGMAEPLARFAWCVREQRPYLTESDITFAPRDYKRYRALGLPFGDAARGVRRLLFVFSFLKPSEDKTAG